MSKPRDPDDPKGLIRESYRIEGISVQECRSIFLDWALSVPAEVAAKDRILRLLAGFGSDAPDHPMTQTLRAALADSDPPRRRGGRAARLDR